MSIRTTTGPATARRKRRPNALSRIAVGVNGHPEGNDAVVLGAAIARTAGAELILVFVHPEPLVVLPEQVNWSSVERQAAAMLREARDAFAPGARIVVETGLSVPRTLERVVRREHRDLLVVGSSRHASEGRVRIGKRTRQLLGRFNCSLAIAPRGMSRRPDGALARIGVGYDGGPGSEAALALAGTIAVSAGAQLLLCAVVDDRVPPVGWFSLLADHAAIQRWEERVVAEMKALRELGLSAAKATGARARAEVSRGRPADALLELSAEVDMLVIGSRRWGPVTRVLLGSTGEALAHEAASPLVIVPRPRGDGRDSSLPT